MQKINIIDDDDPELNIIDHFNVQNFLCLFSIF